MKTMKSELNLWQKLKIKYQYHWLDQEYRLIEPPARPTWYMTHSQKRIERRHAAYIAKLERERQALQETIQELILLRDECLKKENRGEDDSSSSLS